MSLELIKEGLRVNQVIAEDWTQTVIENDIIVPDVKPDIDHILLLDGDVCVTDTEAMQDKVIVNGAILYKILYVADDENKSIKSINTNANFSYALDVPNARQGMKSRIKCDIEHIDHSLLHSRKIGIKTILKVGGRVMDEIEKDMVNGLAGVDNIQLLKENIKVNSYLGSNKINYIIRENLEIPSSKPTIRQILRNDVKITGKDFKMTDNKVIVKGDVNIATLYVGDDENGNIQFMEHEIPFTQFIDMPGANENTDCFVDFQVFDSRFEPGEDDDGEFRMLDGEISVNIYVEGYEKRSVEVLVDAYSPNSRLSMEKQQFKLEDVFSESKGQVIIKDTIVPAADNPEILEVFNVLSKPVLSECSMENDKLVLEGMVANSVLYLANSDEQPICCQKQDVPFKHTIDIKGMTPDMVSDVNMDIEHCNYSMLSSNEVEVRLVITLNVKITAFVSVPLLVKAAENPVEENKALNQPSVTIYFTQPGDSLWKIAKKYLVTVPEIQKVNGLNERDIIEPGQQIFIPRRLSF